VELFAFWFGPLARLQQVVVRNGWDTVEAARARGKGILVLTPHLGCFIEQRVLEMPEQYWWLHKRVKTRPPGALGVY